MGFFASLLKRKNTGVHPSMEENKSCRHTLLAPRWDSAADMGDNEKVTAYRCQGCGTSFTPEEGRALRERAPDEVVSSGS